MYRGLFGNIQTIPMHGMPRLWGPPESMTSMEARVFERAPYDLCAKSGTMVSNVWMTPKSPKSRCQIKLNKCQIYIINGKGLENLDECQIWQQEGGRTTSFCVPENFHMFISHLMHIVLVMFPYYLNCCFYDTLHRDAHRWRCIIDHLITNFMV